MKNTARLYLRMYLLSWLIYSLLSAPLCRFDIFSFDYKMVLLLAALLFAPVNALFVVILIKTRVAAYLRKTVYVAVECILYMLLSLPLNHAIQHFSCLNGEGTTLWRDWEYPISELVTYFVLTAIYLLVYLFRVRKQKEG